MSTAVNLIRNADFTSGRHEPRHWEWSTTSAAAGWHRDGAALGGPSGRMHLAAERPETVATWWQTVSCKADVWYRVEASVECALEETREGTGEGTGEGADGACGLMLRAQMLSDGQPVGEPLATPGILRTAGPQVIRTYLRMAEGTTRLRVGVGIQDARGWARVHEVRVLRLIEPDLVSHPISIPPPAWTCTAPRTVQTAWVCSQQGAARPVVRILERALGEGRVRAVAPGELSAGGAECDALLLPDDRPPRGVRSLAALLRLASERIVVISLRGFASLAGEAVKLRRVEQEDDPICAQVVYGNWITRGFALNDVFPFAGEANGAAVQTQTQYRDTKALRSFLQEQGFERLLVSMCDQDATSNQPVALFREMPRGALIVMDAEPMERRCSTMDEAVPAVHLLLSALGRVLPGMGQYTVPVASEAHFREYVRDLAGRFRGFVLYEDDVPAGRVRRQVVTVGREDRGYGLPMGARPVVLVRTGLYAGDVESAYAGLLFFKQLVRMPPYECPYLRALTARLRLAWLPLAARWESRHGWRRSGARADVEAITAQLRVTTGQTTLEPLAAVIDLVSRPVARPRLVLARGQAGVAHYARWAPQLLRLFPPGRYFTRRATRGFGHAHADSREWSCLDAVRTHGCAEHDADAREEAVLEVEASESLTQDAWYRELVRAGVAVVRIEVPTPEADFVAHSMERMDLAATLLEQAVGMQFGVIGVNRTETAAQVGPFGEIAPGGALIRSREELVPEVR